MGKILTQRILTGEIGTPKKIIIFSRDEAKQHDMRLEYMHRTVATDEVIYRNFSERVEFRIGDVRDYHSVSSAVKDADFVFNAAALKQVPSCEYFPFEAVQTNVIGPENIIRAIRENRLPVDTVVGISTDKACKPVNVMGMTKALQEHVRDRELRALSAAVTAHPRARRRLLVLDRDALVPVTTPGVDVLPAYEWLLAQRLPDGAWPTGIAGGGVYGYVAGYRRLAHSRWGCRSNTTGALACLALHPERRNSPEARRALDLLLGRETRERQALGFEAARLAGAERARGFITFFARFDLAFILYLCWRVGATVEDERVAEMIDFIAEAQGPYGLWEYQPYPQASRWVTLELLRTLNGLDENSRREANWLSLEPRTPFQPYPKKPKRY